MASVLVPLAQGCEEMEAVTIVDLLRRAGIDVTTAALDEQPVKASRGMVLIADMSLEQALEKEYDMLVLPGGLPGADHLNDDPRIHALLQKMHRNKKYIAAICAAPKVLARAGLLDNRKATSFPGSLDADSIKAMDYLEQPVVIDDTLITSRGPGTAMDFALTLIEQLLGREKREQVETPLQRPTL